eukprot:5686626-Amphidinium_carterae.1
MALLELNALTGQETIANLHCPCSNCPSKNYKPTSWSNLLHHVRTKHGVTMAQMKDTKLYELGSKEINEKQRIYYKTKKEACQTLPFFPTPSQTFFHNLHSIVLHLVLKAVKVQKERAEEECGQPSSGHLVMVPTIPAGEEGRDR